MISHCMNLMHARFTILTMTLWWLLLRLAIITSTAHLWTIEALWRSFTTVRLWKWASRIMNRSLSSPLYVFVGDYEMHRGKIELSLILGEFPKTSTIIKIVEISLNCSTYSSSIWSVQVLFWSILEIIQKLCELFFTKPISKKSHISQRS